MPFTREREPNHDEVDWLVASFTLATRAEVGREFVVG